MLKIKVFENSNFISEHEVDQPEFTIGRGSDCDIVLDSHPGISRKHARITLHQGEYLIEKISQGGHFIKDGESISSLQLNEPVTSISIPPYTFKIEAPNISHQELLDEQNPVVEAKNIMIHSEQPNEEEEADLSPKGEDYDDFGDEEKTSIAVIENNNLNYYFKVFKEGKYIKDFPLDKKVIAFGRSKQADFTIESARSSRKHFSIVKLNNVFCLKDLGSSNGTYLNKQPVPANQEIELKSGDVISTEDHKFIFEIKDENFMNKVKHLAVAELATENEDLESLRNNALAIDDSFDRKKLDATIKEQSVDPVLLSKQNKTKKIRIGLIIGIIAILGISLLPKKNNNSAELASKAKEKQRLKELELQAVDHFNLALRFYNQNDFERCLNELDAFDDVGVVPSDIGETSELRVQCEVEKERIQREQDEKRRLKKQKELEQKVALEIANCENMVTEGVDSLKSCLSMAISLDPTNETINSLIDQAQAIELEQEEKEKRQAAYRKRVAKGKALYKKAEKYDENGDWKRAIKTFDKFSNSSYPDPAKLKPQAKRNVASIRSRIDGILAGSIARAKQGIQNEDYKNAVLATREGLKIDRDHEELLELQEKAEKELNSQLRKLYQESIIDEDFGQIEQAKQNWKKIIEQGVPGTNYYEKARKKLKNFGDG